MKAKSIKTVFKVIKNKFLKKSKGIEVTQIIAKLQSDKKFEIGNSFEDFIEKIH